MGVSADSDGNGTLDEKETQALVKAIAEAMAEQFPKILEAMGCPAGEAASARQHMTVSCILPTHPATRSCFAMLVLLFCLVSSFERCGLLLPADASPSPPEYSPDVPREHISVCPVVPTA